MTTLKSSRHMAMIVLILLSLVTAIVPSGAGAQGLQTCEDFGSLDIAQTILDIDPSLAESLDPDGNGIACDHEDGPVEDHARNPKDDFKDEPSGDGDAYLVDIQAELDLLTEQIDRFLEISSLGADASNDDVDELNRIAAGWADYPEIAAAYAAPEGFEDIQNAYLDLAEVFSEAGDLWEAYWAIPAQDDDEETVALDAFEDAFNDAQNQIDEVQRLLGGGGDACCAIEDPTGDSTGDAGEYLATVQEHAESLNADLTLFSTGGETISEVEIDSILENFAEAPEIAASIATPDGYNEVHNAYENFTNDLANIPDLYNAWVDSGMSAGMEDPTQDPVFIELVTATVDADELYFTLVAVIEEFEAGAAPDTDAPAASDDPYLAYVRETVDSLNADLETFLEMMLPTNPSDPETMEVILANWFATPIVNATMALDVPTDYVDIQGAFDDYTNELADAAQHYLNWLDSADETERNVAFENLLESFDNAQKQYVMLDAMLTDAGV